MMLREMKAISEKAVHALSTRWIETYEEFATLVASGDAAPELARVLETDTGAVRKLVQDLSAEAGCAVPQAVPPAPAFAMGLRPPERSEVEQKGNAWLRSRYEAAFHSPSRMSLAGKAETRGVSLVKRFFPVRSQGMERGTCVAFACTAAREFLLPKPVELSEEFLYCLCKLNDGDPEASGTHPLVAAQVLTFLGMCRRVTWPYDPRGWENNEGHAPPPDAAMAEAPRYRIGDSLTWGSPPLGLFLQVLTGIDDGNVALPQRPLVIGVPLFSSVRSPATYRSGKLFGRLGNEPVEGWHAMAVVGFRITPNAPGGGYLICRNSWGQDWAKESNEATGHALVSFRYMEDAYELGCVPVTIFLTQSEMERLAPQGDRAVATRFAEKEEAFVNALCEETVSQESVRESIEECRYREDESLESRRITQRETVRMHVRRVTFDVPRACEKGSIPVRALLKAKVRGQFREALDGFRDGRVGLADLVAGTCQSVREEDRVRCFLLPRDEDDTSLTASGLSVESRFKHIGVLETWLPPVAGLPDAIEARLGVRCCPADMRVPMAKPMEMGSASHADLLVSSWYGLRPEVQTSLGKGVRIGIADTGLDRSHPDLTHVPATACKDFTGSDADRDPIGHGTHCAGIAAGRGVGRHACVGVAPQADVLMAKVFDDEGWGDLDALFRGLDWLLDQNVDVISLSLGTMESPNGMSRVSRTCDYIAEHSPVIVCVSAGNEGPDLGTISCPGDARNVTTVAALDSERRLAGFSSRGSDSPSAHVYGKPDIAGGGVHVVSCRSKDADTNYYPPWSGDRRYTALSGTSMACPGIAGLCALLWSACGDTPPDARKRIVVQALYDSCDVPCGPDGAPYSSVYQVGHGVPNVDAALSALGWRCEAPGGTVEETADHAQAFGDEHGADPVRAAALVCDWLRVPIPASAVSGRDYYPCDAGMLPAPVTDAPVIDRGSWDRHRRAAGDRLWPREALRNEYLAYIKDVRARAASWNATEGAVAHAGFAEWVRELGVGFASWLLGIVDFAVKVIVVDVIEAIVVPVLFGHPFFVDGSQDTSAVPLQTVEAAVLTLRGAKKLLGRPDECRLGIVAVLPGLERAGGEELETWRNRGLVTLSAGTDSNGRGPVAEWLAARGVERVVMALPDASAMRPSPGVAAIEHGRVFEDGGVFALAPPRDGETAYLESRDRRRERCLEAVRAAFVADGMRLGSNSILADRSVRELERCWGRSLLLEIKASDVRVLEDDAGLIIRTPRVNM